MAKEKTLHALDYLANPARHPPAPVCVVYGDEPFLKREVLLALRRQVLGEGDASFSLTVLRGDEAADNQMRDVLDELSTISMFGAGPRMVVIEEADPFVTRYRDQLQDYASRKSHHGVLVLETKAWASNTRLYKLLAESGRQIECRSPTPAQLRKWLTARAQQVHQAKADPAALAALLELVPPEPGLLDQELARLALLTGPDSTITVDLVREHVQGGLTKKVWDMIDAAAEGKTRAALEDLDRLLVSGQQPIALLAQMAAVLRRFAAATQLVERAERAGRRLGIGQALEQAGTQRYFAEKTAGQLRQVGRQRAKKIYHWLLEADLALKGSRSAPDAARIVLEELIVRLSPAAAGSARQNSPIQPR